MRLKIYVWLGVFAAVLSLPAQTNVPIRPISLQQCVQLALEHNFDIAIRRYDPQIQSYALGGDYGYYDPEFRVRALHTFEAAEGEFDPRTGIQSPPGSGREEDIVDGALQGRLWPTGLRYDIGADYQHRTGETERDIVTRDEHGGPTTVTKRGFVPFDQYSTAFNIGLEQPLLRDFWIDKGRLDIKLRHKDVRISEFQLLSTVQDTIRDVEQTYYRLIGALDSAAAWEASMGLAQKLLVDIRARIDAGQLATLDDKQAESEVELRRTELLKVDRTVFAEENRLKSLISNQPDQWHGVRLVPQEKLLAVAQSYDLQESWMSGLNSRPDFLRLKEELERQGLVVKYDYNQLFPYLNAVGTYGRRGFDELTYRKVVDEDVVIGNTTNDITTLVKARDSHYSHALHEVGTEKNLRYSYGVVLRFPLTFRQERYNFKGSKALEARLTAELQQKQQEIMIDIQDAMQGIDLAFSRIQTARRGREAAEVALGAAQQQLDNARATPFSVLRLQRDLRNLRIEEIEALRDYNVALAELHFREGKILNNKGVNVEISNK
ncbi:MAG TPA: TolC family protein [Candidatus Binatia bacterium]|nr:TolC family protein [Candidatus Binatia bacterium]